MARAAKGVPTALNIFALASVVAENGIAADRTFPNGIAVVDAPHIRRCIKAGLVETTGRALKLTDAGVDAVLPEMRERIARMERPSTNGWTPTARQVRDHANMKAAFAVLGGKL